MIFYKYINLKKAIDLSENKLSVDDLFHLATNKKINFYFRVNKIIDCTIDTEFDEKLELELFSNNHNIDRYTNDYFWIADYNLDFVPKDSLPEWGRMYRLNHPPFDFNDGIDFIGEEYIKFIHFSGLIEVPDSIINEYKKEVKLNKLYPYYFLEDEYGNRNTDFTLNFGVEDLIIPNDALYVLPTQLELNDNHRHLQPPLVAEVAEEPQGRISKPQRALFSLLLNKLYPDGKIPNVNSVKEAINTELKKIGLSEVSYNTIAGLMKKT